MQFQTTKHKIKTIYDLNVSNDNSLDKKENKSKILQKESHLFQTPITLYDSGWFDTEILNTNILDDVDQKQYAYLLDDILAASDGTTRPNLDYPVQVSFGFQKEINIPSEFLPFVKVQLLTKTHPDVKFAGFFIDENSYQWDTSLYCRIKGDSTTIFQGYAPSARKFPSTLISAGDIPSSLTSKWYYGTLNFDLGGFTYELRNGNIAYVQTYYDFVELPGYPGNYSYKFFQCSAISNFSSSSITGKGTYTVVTAYDAGGYADQTIVTTKNSTQTASLFEDATSIYASGLLYKDGIYQETCTIDSPCLYFATNGIAYLGAATLNSLSYTHEENADGNKLYRLWYSSDMAREVIFNAGNYLLSNYPTTSDYQSGTLPYTTLNVEVNPDDYPVEETASQAEFSFNRHTWARITQENQSPDKYKLFFSGQILYIAPTSTEQEQSFIYVDEDYNQSGSTYAYDGANRPGKTKITYLPEYYSFKFRLLVSIEVPLEFFTNYSYVKKEY